MRPPSGADVADVTAALPQAAVRSRQRHHSTACVPHRWASRVVVRQRICAPAASNGTVGSP